MDQDAASRRAGKVPQRPELYSTVVIHDDDEEDGEQEDRSSRPIAITLGADDDGGNDFGTMIVKTDRSRPRSRSTSTSSSSSATRGPAPPPPPPPAHLLGGSPFADARRGNPIQWAVDEEEKEEEEYGEGFSTFVVRSGERESVSGTVVRRTGGGDVGSTMSRAVASVQGVGDLGLGKQRKGSGSSQGEEARQLAKMSSSSIPESVTREDPTTKYELLTELGDLRCFFVEIYG